MDLKLSLRARSLASTVIEAAHFQYFFAQHLPRLTNVKSKDDTSTIIEFLEQMVFAVLSSDSK